MNPSVSCTVQCHTVPFALSPPTLREHWVLLCLILYITWQPLTKSDKTHPCMEKRSGESTFTGKWAEIAANSEPPELRHHGHPKQVSYKTSWNH
jgi:hypothetical protein